MKKMFALFVALVILLPVVGLADPADVSSMTDDELKEMISACSAELMKRKTVDPEGILLFEYEGISLYKIGETEITKNGLISVPILIINDRDDSSYVAGSDVICNGWDVNCNFGGATQAHTRKKANMTFLTGDVGLLSLDDVISLKYKWYVYADNKCIYEQEEQEEHRFW